MNKFCTTAQTQSCSVGTQILDGSGPAKVATAQYSYQCS